MKVYIDFETELLYKVQDEKVLYKNQKEEEWHSSCISCETFNVLIIDSIMQEYKGQ